MTFYRAWRQGRAFRLPAEAYRVHRPVHVVIGTDRKHRHFDRRDLAAAVFDSIAEGEDILVACLMPDHLHLLLRTADGLANRVGSLKSTTTRIAWRFGIDGKLWQRRYFDRLVRGERELEALVRYIVENPVRAGLVVESEQYAFAGVWLERFR